MTVVWNFCRWGADVLPGKTSLAERSKEKRPFLLLSSYSIQVPRCTLTRSANQDKPCFHTKSWPVLLESCFQGQRHGGHPRRANNIVPFCLCQDREYSTILDVADFANLINFVPSQSFHHDALGETFLEVTDNKI